MTAINAISSTGSDPATTGAISQNAAKSNASGSMGFDDFLDMVNPLQHIPLVSSIYRGVTGQSINPVSRIAGDALYGGVFGLAAAGISALGAAADEAFASLNDGKSASTTVVAALFGSDKGIDSGSDVQLAAADTTPAATALPAASSKMALLQTPARQSPIVDLPNFSTAAAPSLTADAGAAATTAKQPYGGVMDTSMVANAMQTQSLALALMSGKDKMDEQHAVRNNRFATTVASPVTAPTAQSASLSLPGDATNFSVSNATTQALAPSQKIAAAQAQTASAAQALGQSAMPGAALPASSLAQSLGRTSAAGSGDLKPIKGLDQYRSLAQRVPVMGATFDVSN